MRFDGMYFRPGAYLVRPAIARSVPGYGSATGIDDWNRCSFAARIVEVRRAYGLTIDRREVAALDLSLTGCGRNDLEPVVCAVPSASRAVAASAPAAAHDALSLYDGNRMRYEWPWMCGTGCKAQASE